MYTLINIYSYTGLIVSVVIYGMSCYVSVYVEQTSLILIGIQRVGGHVA